MLPQFDEAFSVTVGFEGGYTEGKGDPGGETKYGISQRAYPKVDIESLTLEQAKAIYYIDYWLAAGCDKLPMQLAPLVFDFAVNSGITNAVRILQRVVGAAEDSKLGPATIKACGKFNQSALAARYLGARLKFMTDLNVWPAFGKGWARRIADQLSVVL